MERTKTQTRFFFKFSKQNCHGIWAYDVGIYRHERIIKGETKIAYGTFFVTLHKSAGKWKIFSDADTQKFSANEQAFNEGQILSFQDKEHDEILLGMKILRIPKSTFLD